MDFFLVYDDCLVLRRIGGLSTKKVITFSEALRVTPYRRFIEFIHPARLPSAGVTPYRRFIETKEDKDKQAAGVTPYRRFIDPHFHRN